MDFDSKYSEEHQEAKKKEIKRDSREEDEDVASLANKMEAFARIFFPLAYIVFNILYWTKYLQDRDNELASEEL